MRILAVSPNLATRAHAGHGQVVGVVGEAGIGKSRLLLEFVLEEIGPSIYNGAIADAQVYLRERVADLDGACYMPEFEYWPRAASRRTSR